MSCQAKAPPYDLVFRGGVLIDGTGGERSKGDLAVKGDLIAAIGELGDALTCQEIDVRGKCITPGFIDSHAHDDRACIAKPAMEAKVSQGVTTVVVGNCGLSLAPLNWPLTVPEPLNLLGGTSDFTFPDFRAYVNAVDAARPKTNVAALVGHSTLRIAAIENLDRKATPRELKVMVDMLHEAMRAGATGLSSGLFYPPAHAAANDEIEPLVKKVSEYGGIYASHLRDEYDGILEAMQEAFAAAQGGEVPLVISHHKCAGPRNWGRSVETLALLDSARMAQEVHLDCYPYTAGSSVLNPDLVEDDVEVLITWSQTHPSASGRMLHSVAEDWGCSQKEAARWLRPGGACYFQMAEEDVRRIIRHPAAMVGSDGLPHEPHPHPRLWGTFPRVIRRYVIEQRLFSLEEAVRKMTSLPASQFRLRNRGVLKVDNYADIVVFDPLSIADRADYERPEQPSSGIELVLVNGQISWQDGTVNGPGAGRFLRLQPMQGQVRL